MEHDDKMRFLEESLSRQLLWIAATEKKTTLIFALNTAMLGVLAAVAPDNLFKWDSASGFFASIAVVLNLLSLGSVAFSMFPRTTGPTGSLIYFGGIHDMKVEEYVQAVKELSAERLFDDFANQCHRNAQIATIKYRWVQRANILLFLSILPWLASLFLLYSASTK